MAHVPVETNFWDDPQAVQLGELLGDRDAWRHVVRLWAWGLQSDLEDGVLRIPDWKIAEVSSYTRTRTQTRTRTENGENHDQDDAKVFVDALKTSGLLVEKKGGLYMAGWSRMKKFFSEKRRLRNYRKRKKNAARTRTQTGTVRGNPSLSPSPYLDEREAAPSALKLHEVEQIGFTRCGALAGPGGASIKALMPIHSHELVDALKTNGNSWKYIAKVIASTREEAASPKPPAYQKPTEQPPTRGWNALEPEEQAS